MVAERLAPHTSVNNPAQLTNDSRDDVMGHDLGRTSNAYGTTTTGGSVLQCPATSTQDEEFFRLLEIVERDSNGRFVCRLIPVSLSEALVTSYTAVSYTWEHNPDVECFITIDDRLVQVQQNVHDLLESLHTTGNKEPMFIDALCIDQNSLSDKNTQVAHMGEVYYYAKEVLVWFGNMPKCLEEDLEMLLHEDRATPKDCLIDVELLHGSPVVEWISLHRYWTRLWIVQEIMLAQKVAFCASTTRIEWQTLVEWFDIGRILKGQLPDHMGCASDLLRWRRRLITRYSDRKKSIPALEAFMSFSSQGCFDVKDKLYGLLALVDLDIAPDYHKSAFDVLMMVILAGVRQMDGMEDLKIASLNIAWDGIKDSESDRTELVRVWCWKMFNVFGFDVHTSEVPEDVISILGQEVLLAKKQLPCNWFLLSGDAGCSDCARAKANDQSFVCSVVSPPPKRPWIKFLSKVGALRFWCLKALGVGRYVL